MLIGVIAAMLLSLAPAVPVASPAQPGPTPLRVEVYVVPPFVIERGEHLTGFSIELWEEIASRLKLKSAYQIASTPDAGFDALRSGSADVGPSGVLITNARNSEFDFSVPILEAGQQVMVREAGAAEAPNPLTDLVRLLFSKTTAAWLGVGLLLIIVPAHLVWVVERRNQEGILPSDKYIPGIFHAAWWTAGTLLAQADEMPRQWLARAFALVWMFVAVVFVALYTAQLTSALTVQEIRGAINGPEDLPGKKVGTIQGSASVDYVRNYNATAVTFDQPAALFQALVDKKVDAVVFWAPVLQYHASHEGKGVVRVVGPEFHKGDLGIIFPDRSPLRKKVNAALLSMKEDGAYDRIYQKWFGDTD
ncbi:MAG TPA: transporter substrate-binding domain-containing protein [Caulobacteraceae bacterium]|nr:transporter substrate-binding domain-containing protein [Caulobacteraceae bacterium]